MIQDKFLDLSNDELLGLLDKHSQDYEDVLQEIFKRQSAGEMKEFIGINNLFKDSNKRIKKIS